MSSSDEENGDELPNTVVVEESPQAKRNDSLLDFVLAQPTPDAPPGKPCDHEDLVSYEREYDSRYCNDENAKFGDAECMHCAAPFLRANLTENPLHFCPNFDLECDAIMCHKCFITRQGATGRSLRKRS